MEWIEPKTDWKITIIQNQYLGDFFNYTDYNRVKNNVLFLLNYANQMYNVPQMDLGDDKNEADLLYADEINAIENSLYAINNQTYGFEFEKKEWKPNKNVPIYEDWNRIEKLSKKIYETLVAQRQAQNRLTFVLGGQKGIKV